ncbi:hypothetical protein [Planctomicrobium piriforme]|uniref:Uncharacterized protein n=1 Tax=Planctomicrobium piriforme TaxID=1576369 RepID=A0A1I3PTN5_9PLAN|nr:hypothetical protein [Planctomicrobium piriforme]SFJ24775.1 hypothetical protein SAMN05421753_11733 [Planctomicrobium piriforme]
MPRFSVFLTIVLLASCGCGRTAISSGGTHAAAESTKKTVNTFVEDAKKTPATAPQQLTTLLESIEANANALGGNFVAVADSAKELKAKYDSKAPKPEIEAATAKLKSSADALTP